MDYDRVIKALGYGMKWGDSDDTFTLSYRVIDLKLPSKPKKLAAIDLIMTFERGVVQSYSLEQGYWGDR